MVTYQGKSMCRGGVRGLTHLETYKKLDMFEGMLRDEARTGYTEKLGSFIVSL